MTLFSNNFQGTVFTQWSYLNTFIFYLYFLTNVGLEILPIMCLVLLTTLNLFCFTKILSYVGFFQIYILLFSFYCKAHYTFSNFLTMGVCFFELKYICVETVKKWATFELFWNKLKNWVFCLILLFSSHFLPLSLYGLTF